MMSYRRGRNTACAQDVIDDALYSLFRRSIEGRTLCKWPRPKSIDQLQF